MGVHTNFTITEGILVLTVETQITTQGLLHTVIVIVLTIFSLLMLYKWTGRTREAVTKHTRDAPTFFVNEEPAEAWVNPYRLKKKKAKRKQKNKPGHIPDYDEWPEWELDHIALLAEQAQERVRAKRRAKRKKNKDNMWFREG